MQPLKDIYTNPAIFRQLSVDLKTAHPRVDQRALYQALTRDLDTLELTARIERAADVCREFLPHDYLEALKVLYKFCEDKPNTFVYMFMPMFVAKFGHNHYKESIIALRDFTQYSTSEIGIRTYLQSTLKPTLKSMHQWAKSDNTHIRRLASEGCRPRLPWARKVQALIDDPSLTWPILEQLKTDPEKYVQKSVANHINDISKDHADWLVARISQWDITHPATQWIIKHGTRSLIKQGHTGVLKLSGHDQAPQIKLTNLNYPRKIRMGEQCCFSIELTSTATIPQKLLIDYQLHFCKKNGQTRAKTFKYRSIELKPHEPYHVNINYHFRDLSTRKHYPGPHKWQLLINGHLQSEHEFRLLA